MLTLLLITLPAFSLSVTFEKTRDYQAYLQITGGAGESTIAEFDSALSGLRKMRGLIIDVRHADSLSSETGAALAQRFLQLPRQEFEFGQDSIGVLNPRGDWQYDKPVVILVDSTLSDGAFVFVRATAQRFFTTTVGLLSRDYEPEVKVKPAPGDTRDVIRLRGQKELSRLVSRFRNQRQDRMEWMFEK